MIGTNNQLFHMFCMYVSTAGVLPLPTRIDYFVAGINLTGLLPLDTAASLTVSIYY